MENQIRENIATRRWVIFAPGRKERPNDWGEKPSKRVDLPAHKADCPFCPGNEGMLPGIILEQPAPEGDGDKPWQTRVVPNKFPALVSEGDNERTEAGLYVTMTGYGQHEVVIESPRHDRDIAQMSPAAVSVLIETYHQRYVDLMRAHNNMMTIIFRNHGERAGTSLIHPHSQIVVTGIVPRYVRWREEEAERYFDQWGRCVYCDILAFELKQQKRVVIENETFIAFVPFAAEVPFELWIMPKRHQADFGSLTDADKDDLAHVLQKTMGLLSEKLNDPDYNYVINSAARYKAGEPQLHWYLQIQPRLTTQAGFEIGSGMRINPSLPEHDAAYLKAGREG